MLISGWRAVTTCSWGRGRGSSATFALVLSTISATREKYMASSCLVSGGAGQAFVVA